MFQFSKTLSTSTFLSSLLLIAMSPAALSSEQWGTKPLGKAIEASDVGAPPVKQKLESRFRKLPQRGEPIPLFKDGQAQCVLIVPAPATKVERRAAQLLKSSLEAMTGGTFTIHSEAEVTVEMNSDAPPRVIDSENRAWPHAIWIGHTSKAAKEKLEVGQLRPEGYQLVTRGPWLFIMGRDTSANLSEVQGTYFGVASLLERHLGLRWLWPGEVGRVVPRSTHVVLPPINEQDEPALPKRTIRNMHVNDRAEIGLALLGASVSDYQRNLDMSATWLANQRTGSSMNLAYGHAYDEWYEKFGEAHPDWFALQANGSRQQGPIRARLCKSNPAVAHQAALQVIDAYRKNPNIDGASISPNDGGPQNWFCMCEGCRKLDPENATPIALFFAKDGKRFEVTYPSLTNRVLTFYNRIAEEVVKELPNARMGAYAYSAYRDVPLGINVHPAIVMGFVGLNYDNDAQRKVDLARWDGWSNHAEKLFLRPNAFHSGEALPMVYPHRLGADVKHCYQTGMIAADFDSLIGNWASDGLNYYVLAKLLWDPSLEIDSIIKDYCQSGFGQAAGPIGHYFSELERATNRVAERDASKIESQLREEERDLETGSTQRRNVKTPFEVAYFDVFTPEFVASLRAILHEAQERVAGDEKILARITLLETGLDYAEAYRRTLEATDIPKARQEFLAWYRDTFRSQPMAINSTYRLWRTAKTFRNVK